jgi:uncharacterized protein (TIGR00251 family)
MKIRIKVRASSRTEKVSHEGNSFIVKVKQPPKEGRANQAVIELLAKHFGVPQSHVRIVSGLRGKNKVIEVAE